MICPGVCAICSQVDDTSGAVSTNFQEGARAYMEGGGGELPTPENDCKKTLFLLHRVRIH